jgi:outer membrane protein W
MPFAVVWDGDPGAAVIVGWQAFVDVKQLWLSVDAKGVVDNVVPVRARVQLNPRLVSVGVRLRLN